MTPYPGDWYRLTITTTTSTGTTLRLRPFFSTTGGTVNVWGAQLEEGAFATSYIPTGASGVITPGYASPAVTRAVDVASITGTNFITATRTNLLLRSQELGNTGSWTRVSVGVSSDVAVAPDGTLTAEKLIVNDGITATSSRLVQVISKAATATTYTFSIYAKTGDVTAGGTLQMIAIDAVTAGNSATTILSTLNGIVQNPASAAGSFSAATSDLLPLDNGWYRCFLTFTSSTETAIQFRLISRSPTTGDNIRGILLWGAQVETGSVPTPYIPTSTAAVTVLDSPWYNQTEGTVFSQYSRFANIAGRIFTFNDTTSSDQIRFNGTVSTAIRPDWQIIDGGSTQANVLGTSEIAVGGTGRSAGAYKINDFQQATNNSLGTADTVGTVPTITVLNIGANETGTGSMLNGTIKRLTYWATRLANATLQAITTP
jgi:hypothetical protein